MGDYYEYDEPDGSCQDCGIDLDSDPEGDHDDHHRQCWKCWRGDGESETSDTGGKEPELPAPAFYGDERWKVAYMRGYHDGLADGRDQREAA